MRNDEVDVNFYAFFGFNVLMLVVLLSVLIIEVYAVLGVGAIIATGSDVVTASALGRLGISFVQLTAYGPIIIIRFFVYLAWFFGNLYILRDVVAVAWTHFAEEYLHEGDL